MRVDLHCVAADYIKATRAFAILAVLASAAGAVTAALYTFIASMQKSLIKFVAIGVLAAAGEAPPPRPWEAERAGGCGGPVREGVVVL